MLPDENKSKLLRDNINIQLKLFTLDLKNVNSFYKDFSDYRLWLSLAQQKMNLKANGSGDFEAAIDYIRNGIRQIPMNYALLYNFGVVNEKLGNYNIARKYLKFAQTVKPDSADAFFSDAVVCFKMGNYADAHFIVTKAIDLVPEYVPE